MTVRLGIGPVGPRQLQGAYRISLVNQIGAFGRSYVVDNGAGGVPDIFQAGDLGTGAFAYSNGLNVVNQRNGTLL